MTWWATVFASVFGMLLATAILNESAGWAPFLINELLRRAIRRLPEKYQARLAEEWSAALADLPTTISKSIYSLGLMIATERIRWRHRDETRRARLRGIRPGAVILAGAARGQTLILSVAGERIRWFGWFFFCVSVILGTYLMSSRVAATRVQVRALDREIARTQADIAAKEELLRARSSMR